MLILFATFLNHAPMYISLVGDSVCIKEQTLVTLKAEGTLAHETLTEHIPSLETHDSIFTSQYLPSLGTKGSKLQELCIRSGPSSLHQTAID